MSWIVNPFLCDVSKVSEMSRGLAEELLKLRCNNETRFALESEQCLQSFWMCRAVRAFKIVQLEATKLLLVFPTTYSCEQDFSALAKLKLKIKISQLFGL